MANREFLEKANTLRENGQNGLADKLYDHLLQVEPNNPEYIFYKAMNVSDSNPELAISLYKKVMELNPKATASLNNITGTAIRSKNNELAISVLNELLNLFPDDLNIYYHRAIHIGLLGDYLNSLLDLYYVIDNSFLCNNSEAFLEDKISANIALCKVELRNKTIAQPMPSIYNEDKFSQVEMKEYQYTLPAKLFGNERFLIEFGKMMGWTIKAIIQKQPDYISWCILNLNNFCVSEDVIELLKRKGINISEIEIINLYKLKIYDSQQVKLRFEGDAPDKVSIDEDGNIIV